MESVLFCHQKSERKKIFERYPKGGKRRLLNICFTKPFLDQGSLLNKYNYDNKERSSNKQNMFEMTKNKNKKCCIKSVRKD